MHLLDPIGQATHTFQITGWPQNPSNKIVVSDCFNSVNWHIVSIVNIVNSVSIVNIVNIVNIFIVSRIYV